MSFYNGSRADTKPGARTTGFGEGLPNFSDARAKLSYDRPVFSERFKNFSPSAKKSGEEILKDLKKQLRREGDMFFNHSPPDWGFTSQKHSPFSKAEDGEDFPRRSGMDDIRGRHPMFRMPAWMSEDDDMSDLAQRMSHTPHFATMGRRGGPWRERRSSGGSAMSATSDDSCDAPHTDKSSQCSAGSSDGAAHEIPIRLEAPCPPSMVQQHPSQQHQQQPTHQQQRQTDHDNEPISPLSNAFSQRKGAQHPVRTTSAVDATQPTEDVPRSTRCSSAPPEMPDQPHPRDTQKPTQQQRFVSKINITPQSPQSPTCSKSTAIPFSPLPAKFNTVPKPFVPTNKQQSESSAAPYVFEQPSVPEIPEHQESQQYQGQQPQYQPQQPPYLAQQHPYQHPQQHSDQQFHPQQPPFQSHHQYHSQPQQQQQSPRQGNQRPSVVRNIPIFVEGRDVPVTNDETDSSQNTPQWGQSWQQQYPQPQASSKPQYQQQPTPQQHYHQQQPTPQQHYHQQQPTPQQHYHQQQPTPQQHYQQQQPTPQQQYYQQHPTPQQQHHHQSKPQFRQQTQPQQQTSTQQSQPIPTPVPAPPPPQYQQEQQQPQPESQPKPQPAKDPRLTQIEAVQASVDEYKAKVDAFNGAKKDREFLYLDEMLTRALLQLDNVDPDGREDVRQARRAVIKNINAAISALEAKASDSDPKENEINSENSHIEQPTETKDREAVLDKTEDSKEPADTLSNNNNDTNDKNAEQSKAETTEQQDTTSVTTSS